ncbi:hypothetical protein KIN20_001738 [Parelaphostrongylus tenuis]|uniref:Uncharacterized protein n=1 Tax=Parelaphostrongylus tenuis TaxID=148309 RepID=A0AAD5MFH4_PARTN|nr:hypothetical protein KIN20_001738 [Parelaphostrongylus tenuis]
MTTNVRFDYLCSVLKCDKPIQRTTDIDMVRPCLATALSSIDSTQISSRIVPVQHAKRSLWTVQKQVALRWQLIVKTNSNPKDKRVRNTQFCRVCINYSQNDLTDDGPLVVQARPTNHISPASINCDRLQLTTRFRVQDIDSEQENQGLKLRLP